MTSLSTFDPFSYLPPMAIISRYADWLTFGLLTIFFIAVVGAVLPEHLRHKTYGKTIIVTTGLMLGIGLYLAKSQLNFSFESLGFLGYAILLSFFGLITFAFMKRLGINPFEAGCLSYALVFLSIKAFSPNLYDAAARFFPPLNLITLIVFFWCAWMLLKGLFRMGRGSNLNSAVSSLHGGHIKPADYEMLGREEDFEIKERKYLKGKPLKLTRHEIHTAKDLDHALREIAITLKENPEIPTEEAIEILKFIKKIQKKEQDFTQTLQSLAKHIEHVKESDRLKIKELKHRYEEAKDEKKRHQIHQEYELESKKIEIFDFIRDYERTIASNLNMFNEQINKAAPLINMNQGREAHHYIAAAHHILFKIISLLEEIEQHEKHLFSISKNEQHLQHKERKVN